MNNKIDRAVSLFGASRQGPEHFAVAQVTIAREIVGNDALEADAECRKLRAFEHSDQTSFDATDTFGGLLAAQLGVSRERYDLRICDEKMFRMLWTARQAADMLGVPYGIYISIAVNYLQDVKGKKRINPKMFIAPDVQLHVMDRWNAEMSVNCAG